VRCSSQNIQEQELRRPAILAMLMLSPLAMSAAGAEAEGEESRLQAGLASRIVSGSGLWLDWLEEIDRRGLAGELLAEGLPIRRWPPRRAATSGTGR
jgi:hypothetical protein